MQVVPETCQHSGWQPWIYEVRLTLGCMSTIFIVYIKSRGVIYHRSDLRNTTDEDLIWFRGSGFIAFTLYYSKRSYVYFKGINQLRCCHDMFGSMFWEEQYMNLNHTSAPPCSSLGLHPSHLPLYLICTCFLPLPVIPPLPAVLISGPCALLTFAPFLGISLVSYAVLWVVIVMLPLFSVNPSWYHSFSRNPCNCASNFPPHPHAFSSSVTIPLLFPPHHYLLLKY